jgi:hypothetical protein
LQFNFKIGLKGKAVLPNFFVIGAQKSGTTSLHEYLRVHPDIYLPEQKETKFFVNNAIYCKGIEYYENEFFDKWNGESAIGEIDPEYMYFERGLTRIAEHLNLADLKFICLLRQPVDRAFSHYLMTYRRGLEHLSFEDAIAAEPARIRQDDASRSHYSYFDRGLYAKQLKRFMEVVDPSRMLFILSEELASSPEQEVARCLEFLQVEKNVTSIPLDQRFHQAAVPRSASLLHWITADGWHKKMVRKILPNERLRLGLRAKLLSWNEKEGGNLELSAELRRELLLRYREDILELEGLTGLNLAHWLDGDG